MRIEFDISAKDLDLYLKEKYNFGLLEFTESVFFIYKEYVFKALKKEQKLANQRIKDLKKAKKNLISIKDDIDNHDIHPILNKIDFSIKQRENFIKFAAKLYLYSGQKDRINPGNLLPLVWSFAMKKRGRICWQDIERLYCWFIDKFEFTDLENIFEKEDKFPNLNTLRKKCRGYLTKNKYFNLKKLSYHIFSDCFLRRKKLNLPLRDLPEPFDIELELLKYNPGISVHIEKEKNIY